MLTITKIESNFSDTFKNTYHEKKEFKTQRT